MNTQLQLTNENNATLISSLNTQIVSLNNQVNDLLGQVGDNSSVVSALNSKIAELEKSIAYYEQYIASLESGEQVVATFEFNGSVYSIQILSKGAYASVTTPTSTDYVIFNYWTVNNEQVDLSTYPVNTNTKFVANVTRKYDVKFMVDNAEYDSQVVTENGFATLPSAPSKAGYEFDGWAINGNIVVDVDSKEVTQNVTYTAVFTKLHTVTFMCEGVIKSTQTIRNGNCATNVEIPSTTYVVFNGWTLNGVIVDVTTQPIYADTTFIADITKYYDVFFMVDNEEYDHQIVVENGYAEVPAQPSMEFHSFDGWTLNNDDQVVDISSYKINSSITFYAKFTQLSGVYEMTWNGLTDFKAEYIWSDGENIYYSNNDSRVGLFGQYVLDNDTNTWNEKVWNGLKNPVGVCIWSDGKNIYHSNDSSQYVLNKETSTWTKKVWNGLTNFYGIGVWTDGENIYYSRSSNQYILDRETDTWSKMTWNGMNNFDGDRVWTDGTDYYVITNFSDSSKPNNYKLNKGNHEWVPVTFNINMNSYTNVNYYKGYTLCDYGTDLYVFNSETKNWDLLNWSSDVSFSLNDRYFWTDGENYYNSDGDEQYIVYINPLDIVEQ